MHKTFLGTFWGVQDLEFVFRCPKPLPSFLTFKNFIHEQKCASALLNRVFKVFHLKLL